MSKVPAVVERQGINQALWDTMGGAMQKSTLERSQALEAGNFTFDAAKQEIVINPPAASQLASAPLSPEAQQNVAIASAPIQVKAVTLADTVRVQQMILGNEVEDKQFLAPLGIVGRSPNMGDVTRLENLLKSTPSPAGAGATSGPPAAAPAPNISTFQRRGVEEAIGEIGRGQLRRPVREDVANVRAMAQGQKPVESEYLKQLGLSGDMPTMDDVTWLEAVANGIPLDAMGNFDREAAIAMGNRALNPPERFAPTAPTAPPPATTEPSRLGRIGTGLITQEQADRETLLTKYKIGEGYDLAHAIQDGLPVEWLLTLFSQEDVDRAVIVASELDSLPKELVAELREEEQRKRMLSGLAPLVEVGGGPSVTAPLAPPSPQVIDQQFEQALQEQKAITEEQWAAVVEQTAFQEGGLTQAQAMQAQVDALAQSAEKIFGTPVTIEQLEMMVATNPQEVVNRVVAYGPSTDSYILLSKMGITSVQYDQLFAEEAERQRVEKESKKWAVLTTLPKVLMQQPLANVLGALAQSDMDKFLAELRVRGDTPEVRQALLTILPEATDQDITELFASLGGKETEPEKLLRILFPEEDPIALATLSQEQPELLKAKLDNMAPSPERAKLRNLLYGVPTTAEELRVQPADPDSPLGREWPDGVPLSLEEAQLSSKGLLSDEDYKKLYVKRDEAWYDYLKAHPDDIRLAYRDTFSWVEALSRVKRDWEGSAGYLPIQAETPIGRAMAASYDTGWKYPSWIPLIGDTPITVGVQGTVELAFMFLPMPTAGAAAKYARAAVKANMAAGNIPKAVGWTVISILPTAAEYLVEKPLAFGLKVGLYVPTKAVQGAKSLFGKGATEASITETLELSLDKGLVDFAKKQGWSEADMNTAANFYLKDNADEYFKIAKEALDKSAGDYAKATRDIIQNLEPGLKKAHLDATIAMATVGQAPDVAEAIVKVADDVAKGKVPTTAEAVGARVAEEAKVINPTATEVKIVKTPAMVEEAARKGVPVSELEGASGDEIAAKVIDIATPEKPPMPKGEAPKVTEPKPTVPEVKPVAPPKPTEIKVGDKVQDTQGRKWTVTKADDPSLVGVKSEAGAETRLGRDVVQKVEAAVPEGKAIPKAAEIPKKPTPEVYYHGSPVKDLDVIKASDGDWGIGVYFTTAKEGAVEYSKGRANIRRFVLGDTDVEPTIGTVYRIGAKPKKPLIINTIEDYNRYLDEGEKLFGENTERNMSKWARKEGYDGIRDNLKQEGIIFDIESVPIVSEAKAIPKAAEGMPKVPVSSLSEVQTGQPFSMKLYRGEVTELGNRERGVFMTPDPQKANAFTEKVSFTPSGRVWEVPEGSRVSFGKETFSNPLVLPEKYSKEAGEFLGHAETKKYWMGEIELDKALATKARSEGYDSIVYTKGEFGAGEVVDLRIRTIPKQWDAMPKAGRAKVAKQAGLEGAGGKAWQQLDNAEKEIITRSTDEGTLATLKGLGADLPPEMAAKVKRLPPLVTAGGAGMDPADKLTMMIKNAKSVNKDTITNVSAEKAKRVGAGAARLEKGMAKGEGEQAFFSATGALKGELPKSPQFQPPRPLMSEGEIIDLFQQINMFKRAGTTELRFFEKINAGRAMTKLLDGTIPQRKELMLLEEIFGSDLVGAALGKRALGSKIWDNFVDVLNIPRTLLTTFDFSAMLRQGALLAGEPTSYAKATKDMLKVVFSKKNFDNLDAAMKAHPLYGKAVDADLYLAPVSKAASLAQREESFISRLITNIPVVGQVVEASQRSYVGFLNSARSRTFYKYAELWGKEATENDLKALAKFVNAATGRGSLGALEESSAVLAAGLFSPRLIVSRVQAPFSLISSSALARKVAAKNLLAFTGAVGSTLALLKFSGLADVELDPRSSDFLKIRVGNTRIDLAAGYQPLIRYTTQLITARGKSAETGEVYEANRGEIAMRFLRSKLAPGPSFFVDALTGEDFIGDEIFERSVGEIMLKEFAPMTIQDILDAIELDGAWGGLLAGGPAFFGAGVTTFESLPKNTQVEWQDSLEEYGAIPTNALEREKFGIDFSREDYRENNPEADAKLFILGDVSTIQTIEAVDEVLRLIEENKIDWKQIRGIDTWMENAEARKKYGLPREVVNTPTEMLLKRLLGDDSDLILGDEAYEKIATLTEKNKKEQEEFDAIRGSDLTEEKQLKDKYLDEHKEFERRGRLIDAYGEGYAGTDQYSQDQFAEDWADYYLSDHSGFEDDWFFQEHEDFYRVMTSTTIRGEKAWTPRDFSLVPTREVAAKYDEWKKQKGDAAKWDYLETWANQDLRDYVNKEREAEGIKKGLSAENAKLYAEYYSRKRSGYEDDWWLQEHKDYYEEAVDKGILTGRDFSKVPTREVARLYDTYQKLERQDPKYGIEMRLDFPLLENWGVLAGKWQPLDLNERIFRTEVSLIPLKAARDALTTEAARNVWDAEHPEYQQALTWIEAAKLPFDKLPVESKPGYTKWEFENDYMVYKGEKRTGYEDDWWLQEHGKFYEAMVDIGMAKGGISERDFFRVPTREQVAIYDEHNPVWNGLSEDHEKGIYDQSQYYLDNPDFFKAAMKIKDGKLTSDEIAAKLTKLQSETPTRAEAKALQKYNTTPTGDRLALRRSYPDVEAAVMKWKGLEPLGDRGKPEPEKKILDFAKHKEWTKEDWESLPEIGPSTAKKIMDWLAISGGTIASIDDLDRVPGIGPATIKKIKDYLASQEVGKEIPLQQQALGVENNKVATGLNLRTTSLQTLKRTENGDLQQIQNEEPLDEDTLKFWADLFEDRDMWTDEQWDRGGEWLKNDMGLTPDQIKGIIGLTRSGRFWWWGYPVVGPGTLRGLLEELLKEFTFDEIIEQGAKTEGEAKQLWVARKDKYNQAEIEGIEKAKPQEIRTPDGITRKITRDWGGELGKTPSLPENLEASTREFLNNLRGNEIIYYLPPYNDWTSDWYRGDAYKVGGDVYDVWVERLGWQESEMEQYVINRGKWLDLASQVGLEKAVQLLKVFAGEEGGGITPIPPMPSIPKGINILDFFTNRELPTKEPKFSIPEQPLPPEPEVDELPPSEQPLPAPGSPLQHWWETGESEDWLKSQGILHRDYPEDLWWQAALIAKNSYPNWGLSWEEAVKIAREARRGRLRWDGHIVKSPWQLVGLIDEIRDKVTKQAFLMKLGLDKSV